MPSSSPAIVTLSARTPPVNFAPDSMVRSPWTLTSPLNLPATRTLPPPSILPSMVMSSAMSDSLRATLGFARGAAAATGVGVGAGTSSGFGGASNRTGSLVSGTGVDAGREGTASFHMAMTLSLKGAGCQG